MKRTFEKAEIIIISEDGEYITSSRLVYAAKPNFGFVRDGCFTLHVFQQPPSLDELHNWSFSIDFLNFLSDEGVKMFFIADNEKGVVIYTTLSKFQKNGVEYLHPEHGPELRLPKRFWEIEYVLLLEE